MKHSCIQIGTKANENNKAFQHSSCFFNRFNLINNLRNHFQVKKNSFLSLLLCFSFAVTFAGERKSPDGDFEQPLSGRAQKKILNQARKHYFNGDIKSAKEKYLQLLKADSANFTYNYEFGTLLYDTWIDAFHAVPYLERALRNSPADTLGELYFYLADMYQIGGRHTLARSYYSSYLYALQKFGTDMPAEEEMNMVSDIKLRIAQCQNAEATASIRYTNTIEINGKKKRYSIENAGNDINSPFDDYSPVLSKNDSVIFFTSRREGGTGRKTDANDEKYFEDIYTSSLSDNKWTKARNLGKPINTRMHEASNYVSLDDKTMYIYKGVSKGSIYKSQNKDGKWEAPVKVGSSINSPRAWETSSITFSGNTFYVVSDRKGGLGGRDIYKSIRKNDGTWGEMENLGNTINTPYDEESPFFTADGKTLFFSSTGHNSIGGFDIFKSKLGDDGKWSEPENLGTAINTPAHDIFFVIDNKMQHAYFSSNRIQDSRIQMDIYSVNFECDNIPLATVKGITKPGIALSVTEKDTKRLVGNYTTDEKGEYTVQLPPDNTYLFSLASASVATGSGSGAEIASAEIFIPKQCKEFTLFQKLQIDSAFQQNAATGEMQYVATSHFTNLFFEDSSASSVSDIERLIAKAETEKPEGYATATAAATGKYEGKLPVPATASSPSASVSTAASASPPSSSSSPSISFQVVLFNFDKSTLMADAKEELKKTAAYLKENKDKTITVTAHTDNAGAEEYNMKLSKRRAKAAVSYLTSNGIRRKRISAEAFGETKPVSDNSTEEGRAKNRRVEISVSE